MHAAWFAGLAIVLVLVLETVEIGQKLEGEGRGRASRGHEDFCPLGEVLDDRLRSRHLDQAHDEELPTAPFLGTITKEAQVKLWPAGIEAENDPLVSNEGNSVSRHQDELIPTRASLIKRLKDWQDQSSWQEFFDIYWKLIYGVARKAGLTDDEAQEVVQETLVSVAKHMPGFDYDPQIGSFKAWLLTMTRWRIIGQFRKRNPSLRQGACTDEAAGKTRMIEKVPDPAGNALEEMWEQEWQTNLLEAATAHVKRSMDPHKYQIFDLYVNKGCPPEQVASQFGISVNLVYVTKHRIAEAIKSEVLRLEQKMT